MRPKHQADVNLQNNEASLTARQAALLALSMACAVLVVGQLYVTIPLVGDIASRFAVAPADAAVTGSAFGLAYAFGFLIFGPLSDRYGRKRVIVAGLGFTALATLLVGVAHGFGLLLAARALQGIAASTFPPVALSLLAEELPPPHRPIAISLMSFAFLGSAPLAQFLAAEVGTLPSVMFGLAPLYLFGAVGLCFAARADTVPAWRRAETQGQSGGRGLASLFGDAAIPAAWAAAVTVLFGFVSFHGGAQALGADLAVDLQTLRLAGLPPLLLTIAAAPLTRRFGASVTARIGLLAAAFALVLACVGTPDIVIVASIVLSAGVALAVPGLIATVAGCASNDNRGLALAVYSFCLFLGASIAPPVAQALAGFGTVPLWLLPSVLLAGAAICITVGGRRPASSTFNPD